MSIDFTGYDEGDVLQMLIDNARPFNIVYSKLGPLPKEMLNALILRNEIQYYNGRMLGITFKQFPLMDPTKYDKYNGEGQMEKALKTLYDRTVI